MNTYLALTIGPIYKTINASQRTRMLWGASFLFSYLIRELVKLLQDGKFNDGTLIDDKHPECKIEGKLLIPYAEGIEKDECIAGEGKYPDRILIHSEKGDFEKVQLAITVLIQFLGREIAQHLNKQSNEEGIIKDLADYLQFYFIEKEIAEGENAISSLYDDLDVLELRGNYLANARHNYLFYYLFYLSLKRNNKHSLLAQVAFPSKVDKRFRSLIEISTAGFSNPVRKNQQYDDLVKKCFVDKQKEDKPNEHISFRENRFDDDDDLQDEFIKELRTSKDFTTQFRKYHQYVAVIYADGDRIGTTIKKIGDRNTTIKKFSKKLLDFNKEVVTFINEYGGAPVYIGGDDIFTFVPLASIDKDGNQTTIFNLIKNIDTAFGEYFTKEYADELGVKRPSLSYGVAIAYYKQPLNETMELAHKLLSKAKKQTDKNAIELILQEHSGQQFKLSVLKNKERSYDQICELMHSLTSKLFTKDDGQERDFINSITHKLKDPLFKTLLLAVATDHRRLDEFFKNSFNEPIHKGAMEQYLAQVKELIKGIFADYGDNEIRIDNLYSTLRLIDFMHKNPKDE
jgi:CRISPR-associated protein Cmr2